MLRGCLAFEEKTENDEKYPALNAAVLVATTMFLSAAWDDARGESDGESSEPLVNSA